MKMNKEKAICHLFPDNCPQITTKLLRGLNKRKSAGSICIYLNRTFPVIEKNVQESMNVVEELPSERYGGILQPSILVRILQTKTSTFHVLLLELILGITPGISLTTMWKIIKGPRNWLIHGVRFRLGFIFFMKAVGKNVQYISWGGNPYVGDIRDAVIYFINFLYNRIYVLMAPEVRYFRKGISVKKIGLLPYHGVSYNGPCLKEFSNVCIIGNSSWSIDYYIPLLDQFRPGEWKKIICMLNYGDEKHPEKLQKFIEKYKSRFGDMFFPWCKRVPFEEYSKIMDTANIYICPRKTQTGLGAIYLSLQQGKTVFLRGDNYQWLKWLGLYVYDLDQITDYSVSSFQKLFLTPEKQRENCRRMHEIFKGLLSAERWDAEVIKGFSSRKDANRTAVDDLQPKWDF